MGVLAPVTSLAACPEGHLYPLLSAIDGAVDQYLTYWRCARETPRTMLAEANVETLRMDFRLALKREVERIVGSAFIEKTPGVAAIAALPAALTLWPKARIIFAKRRGIENVMSACRKFPNHSFEFNCKIWAESMAAWLSISPAIKSLSVEVDQLDLARAPDKVARDLGAFLELTPAQVQKIATMTPANRTETTQDDGLCFDLVGLDAAPWTRKQKRTFLHICGEQMEAFGYTLDQRYFGEAKSAADNNKLVEIKKSVEKIGRPWLQSSYYADAERNTHIFWDENSPFNQFYKRMDTSGSVLELACGHGRHAERVAPHCKRLILMDIHWTNLGRCRKRLRQYPHVEYYRNSGFDFRPLENCEVNAIYSYESMTHFSPDLVLSYLLDTARVLLPGGMAVYHHSNYDAPPYQDYSLNPHARNHMPFDLFCSFVDLAKLEIVESRALCWGNVSALDRLTLLRRLT
jgi:SAM-dependent methyltransferase